MDEKETLPASRMKLDSGRFFPIRIQPRDETVASFVTMIKRTLTAVFATCMFCAAALSQTGYSESVPYVAKPPAKSDKKKKRGDDKQKAAPAPAPVAIDTTKPEVVTIPISVFNKFDAVVSDLTKSNVSVFVDGNEVAVTSFDKESEPLNVVLVLDMSPSAYTKLEAIKQDALKLVKELPANTRIMIVDFHSQLNVDTQLTTDRTAIEKGINKAQMGDGTSIYSAIEVLFQKVFPVVPGRKAMILFTDGVDTTSRKASYSSSLAEVEKASVSINPVLYDTMKDPPRSMAPNRVLDEIIRQNPGLFSVGSNSRKEYATGKEYLTDLAHASGGRVIAAEKFDERLSSLAAELQTRYYATISIPKGGATSKRLKVRINRPGLKVQARGSFIEN